MTRVTDTDRWRNGEREGFPFVGRGTELRRLTAAVRRPSSVVVVEGEGGAGKSRLVHEAARVLSLQERRVLVGYCHPLREPFPFGPVLEALRSAGNWLPPTADIPPVVGCLGPLLPDLADLLPPVPPGRTAGQQQRLQQIQAVRALLDVLSPLVLCVEDLHWADEATQELLLLLGRDPPAGLSLVLTYRREDLAPGEPMLGSGYRRGPSTGGCEIRLRPFGLGEVQELASAALGGQADRQLAEALHRRSAGLPLIVEEDLITLVESAHEPGSGGRGPALASVLERAEVPRTLREAVSARLATLNGPALALVEAAAVLDVPADELLLARTACLEPNEAARAVTDALRAAVLVELPDGKYGLRHALAQRVVYLGIPGPGRRRLHRQAIEELRRLPSPPLVQIAHHTRALGDRQAWMLVAQEAADQAVALGDQGTAAGLLHEVLADTGLADDIRSRAALRLVGIASHSIDYTTSLSALRRLLDSVRMPTVVRGEIRLHLGLLMINQGRDQRRGGDELRRAAVELSQKPHLAACAMAALALPESERPLAVDEQWLARAEQTISGGASPGVVASVRCSRLSLRAAAGDPGVWDAVESVPRHIETPGAAVQNARTVFFLGGIAVFLGHDERGRRLIEEGREMSRLLGSAMLVTSADNQLLKLAFLGGEWEGLEERFEALRAENRSFMFREIESSLVLARLMAARGQQHTALAHFTEILERAEERAAFTGISQAAAEIGRILLDQPDSTGEAWQKVQPALRSYLGKEVWFGSDLMPVAVEAALASGHRTDAEALVTRFEQLTGGRDLPAAHAELLLCKALIAMADAPGTAASRCDEAAEAFRRIGRPYETLRATERALRLRASSAPSDDIISGLSDTADAYAVLGAEHDAARCRHALRVLGHVQPNRRGRRGYGSALSPRERQVARYLTEGVGNREIAQALFLSPRTVEHHVASVLRKLGLPHRDALKGRLLDDP